ncbi:MAG TPA: hypothetical protein VEN31_07945 [Candidatus Bathyarchaeia archaeon]|nr:hypothetical protein [Candidatus Bathyarchaeia archaeon]
MSAATSGLVEAASKRLRIVRLAVADRITPRNAALVLLIAVPMAAQAIGLLPEITVGVANVNDDTEHALYIENASDALARGENVLDFWVPEMDEGFPQFLYYQNLPHLSVVALHRVLLGTIDIFTVFNIVRYLGLVLLPLTVFWSMRRMDFDTVAAAVAASGSTLLATNFLYGFDFGSYLWRGLGLYTQIWAMHLSFIALASLWRLLRYGTGFRWTAVVLAVLVLSHLLYAYMMVVTAALLLVWGVTRANALVRIARLAGAGAIALAITSWMWLPYVLARGFQNASPYLQPEKYASYGASTVLGWLFSGELTDYGRLPVLAVLLAVGVIAAARLRASSSAFALVLFMVWLGLFFGRGTLGPLASLLPLQETLLFHRFIGGVHIAAIMLIGVGGSAIFTLLQAERSHARTALAAAAIAILLVPAVKERLDFENLNGLWMRQTKAAIDADTDMATIVGALRDLPAGRVYAGLRSNWGQQLDFAIPFNSVHAYQYLVTERFRMLAPPYGGASLNSDLQFDFNDQIAAQYDLYNVRYVVAPRGLAVPSFLQVLRTTNRYVLYTAPSSGQAEYVALADREQVSTAAKLFPRNRAFVNGPGPVSRTYIRWDFPAPGDRVVSGEVSGCLSGTLRYERVQASRFDFISSCPSEATLVVKETYHPNWHATVDGRPVETFMVSPSFIGMTLPAADHFVTVEYLSTPSKTPLLVLGLLVIAALVLGRRDLPERLRRLRARFEALRRRVMRLRIAR